jgi:amino acid transporter
MSTTSEHAHSHALGLGGAWAMAVGGMIGGGIFSTLGVVISVAGYWAWFSFLVGGLIAFATGHSYASLTVALDEPGGSFAYLRALGQPRLARIAAWVLIAGYTLTVAVYAFTFGAYISFALGGPAWIAHFFAVAAIVLLAGLNLMGAREATVIEVIAVWGKLVILLGLAAFGLSQWAPERLVAPHAEPGFLAAIVGTGVVFMAYEGFQLLAYDYDEMRDQERTIHLAMPLAIAATCLVYLAVAVGTPMLTGAQAIIDHKEVALAEAGQAALGSVGFVLVTIAAVFSTGSAINATVFATSRLADYAASEGELPAIFARRNGEGVPWFGTIAISTVAAVLATVGGIDQLVEGGSFVFLLVFALVNWVALKRREGHPAFAWFGLIGSFGSALVLVGYQLGLV